jgi:hypothetical protein
MNVLRHCRASSFVRDFLLVAFVTLFFCGTGCLAALGKPRLGNPDLLAVGPGKAGSSAGIILHALATPSDDVLAGLATSEAVLESDPTRPSTAMANVRGWLRSGNRRLIKSALDLCEQARGADDAVRDLQRLLRQRGGAALRAQAARLLATVHQPGLGISRSLAELLREENRNLRRVAADALIDLLRYRVRLPADLQRLLADPKGEWRQAAVAVVLAVGRSSFPLVSVLAEIAALDRPSPAQIATAIAPRLLPGGGVLAAAGLLQMLAPQPSERAPGVEDPVPPIGPDDEAVDLGADDLDDLAEPGDVEE